MINRLSIMVSVILMTTISCSIRNHQTEELLYEDTFIRFNERTWNKASHTFENNLARFSAKNIEVQEGKLILKLSAEVNGEKDFTASEVRSTKAFKYGRFVARLKAAKGNGIISAFFLYDNKGKNNHEIDIEFSGKDLDFIHLNNYTDKTSNDKSFPLGFDPSDDFHEYAITWLPEKISWEVDGKEVYSTRENVPSQKMKLMLNIWASKSNNWAGKLDPQVLPQQLEIDYIKIYSINKDN